MENLEDEHVSGESCQSEWNKFPSTVSSTLGSAWVSYHSVHSRIRALAKDLDLDTSARNHVQHDRPARPAGLGGVQYEEVETGFPEACCTS